MKQACLVYGSNLTNNGFFSQHSSPFDHVALLNHTVRSSMGANLSKAMGLHLPALRVSTIIYPNS